MSFDFKDIGKKIVGYGLPILGGALGGPSGAIVAKMIADALGTTDEPEKIMDAVSNPECKGALCNLESTNHAELKRISVDLYFGDKTEEK